MNDKRWIAHINTFRIDNDVRKNVYDFSKRFLCIFNRPDNKNGINHGKTIYLRKRNVFIFMYIFFLSDIFS